MINPSSISIKKDRAKSTFNSPVISIYGKRDGLIGTSFFRNSVLLDSKNRMWWGTSKSLAMLDLDNFKIPIDPPVIQLNRVDINGGFIDFNNLTDSSKLEMEFDSIAKFYNYPFNLTLPYNHNYLTFHFSAMEWSAPHKIRYSFKMEDLNDKWSQPAAEAKADYRNLSYGTHTFKVRAIGAAQKWSETFEYAFIILPPWWHTWWARIAYAITGILLVMGIVKFRTKSINKQKTVLKLIVKKRTKEISSQKEELEISMKQLKKSQSQLVQSEKMASLGVLTAGIAHEINNPLNFISAGTTSLERDVKDLNDLTKHFNEFIKILPQKEQDEWGKLKRELYFDELQESIPEIFKYVKIGTSRISKIIDGLKTFSRLDKNDLKKTNIHEGLDATLFLLQPNFNKDIAIIKNYDLDLGDVLCYPGPLNQVFMNLISNAADAIDKTGTINIKTSKNKEYISISIKDTGSGIAPEVLDKIFDPFFTTKEIGKGTGLGLSISQGIIEKHKGKLTVESTIGVGSEFIIILPIEKGKTTNIKPNKVDRN